MKTFLKITVGAAALGLAVLAALPTRHAQPAQVSLHAAAASAPQASAKGVGEFDDLLGDPAQMGAFAPDAPASNSELEGMLGLTPGTLQSVTPCGDPSINAFDGSVDPLSIDWAPPADDPSGDGVTPTQAMDTMPPSPADTMILASAGNSNGSGAGSGLPGPYLGSGSSNYSIGGGAGGGGGGSGGHSGSSGHSGNTGGEGILGASGNSVTNADSAGSAVPLPSSLLMAPLALLAAAAFLSRHRKHADV